MPSSQSAMPAFFAFLQLNMREARTMVAGVADCWVAPVARYDATGGFGEETWIEAQPETVIAWRLGGSHVHCEIGPYRGQTITHDHGMTLQPTGLASRFRATAGIRFAHFMVPDALVRRVADDLSIASQHGAVLQDLRVMHDDALLRHLNDYLHSASHPAHPPSRVQMEARAVLIVERLLTMHHRLRVQPEARGGLPPWRLRRVFDYIEAHLAEDIGLAELAAVADLSPHHFCRAFRQSTGTTPHGWLTTQRIEAAKQLMIDHPAMGLIEVALAVGYGGHAAFATAFRRATGRTPSAWRADTR